MTFIARTPPQPSNIDLALCITLVRSQPPSLTTFEYIQLLQSLTVLGTHGQGEEPLTYTQMTGVRDVISGHTWKKLLDIANKKIMNLRAMLLDVEIERDMLQAKVKGPRKRTANVDVQSAVDVEREGGRPPLGPSKNQSLYSTLSVFNKAYEAQIPSKLYLQDLAPWTEFAPRLLDSLKILQHATAPKVISVAIQQTCRMLSSMTQNLCKGITVEPREGGGLIQLDKDLCLVSQIHGPRISKSLPSILLNAIDEVLAALVKLHSRQMPYDRTSSKVHSASVNDEDTASASNAIMIALTSILSSIHINSITILEYHTKQAKITMTDSNGLSPTSNSPTSPPQCSATGKGTYMVPDLRKEITSFFVQLIRSLRGDIQQHRDLIEAMTFSLMTVFGSQIAKFNIAPNSRKSSGIESKDRKNRGKQTHGKIKVNIICEEESLYIQDLTGEETSWFWLEILDVLWEKYLGNLEYMDTTSNGRFPQACSGGLGETGDPHASYITQIESRKSMVTEAKRKLKEALLQAVLGPGTATGEKGPGKGMRLTNVPALNEIWRMIGWDEQV
ncbi:hypothetical protein BGX38DRAFT_1208730 [Terfezia claveryi]|nr:hypothetical protein BGX38DRAFT_1208730 [Terfezia claveryi]